MTIEMATLTLIVIDTAKEIKVGVGNNWPPVVLGKGEIQLQKVVADAMAT